VLGIGACSKAPERAAFNVDENLTTTDFNQTSAAAIPTPNYDDSEGDRYFYVAAVSEEDQKKGKAVGDVTTIRFLGERDGVYRLELIGPSGQHLATSECKKPCRVTKTVWSDGSVSRGGFNAGSILGSAFEDAFNGFLTVANGRKVSGGSQAPQRELSAIPAQFLGEWNEKLSDCGTGNNDTRLRIDPTLLHFYESDAVVKDVLVQNARTVTVTGLFSGEGETWTDKYRMTLSPSGNELISGDVTRYRCG
jgi:hypothetical protein